MYDELIEKLHFNEYHRHIHERVIPTDFVILSLEFHRKFEGKESSRYEQKMVISDTIIVLADKRGYCIYSNKISACPPSPPNPFTPSKTNFILVHFQTIFTESDSAWHVLKSRSRRTLVNYLSKTIRGVLL